MHRQALVTSSNLLGSYTTPFFAVVALEKYWDADTAELRRYLGNEAAKSIRTKRQSIKYQNSEY